MTFISNNCTSSLDRQIKKKQNSRFLFNIPHPLLSDKFLTMCEEDKIKSSGSSTKTGLNLSVKSAARSSQPAEKRSHSEVTESNFGDEVTMLNKQIEQMNSDLQETRDSIKGLLSKDEIKNFIVRTKEAL